MRRTRFGLGLTSTVLPVIMLASMSVVAAEAKESTTATSAVTAVANEARPDKTKSGRLRFRSTDGTCACTCAKGGASEAEIRRAEELRARAGN